MLTDTQQKYITLCVNSSFENTLVFLSHVANHSVSKNPNFETRSLSGNTKAYYRVTPEMNTFYSSMVGHEIVHSAMVGGHDELNKHPTEFFTVAAGFEGCYLIAGDSAYCFARKSTGVLVPDDEIKGTIRSIIDKLVLNNILILPGTSNGKKTTH